MTWGGIPRLKTRPEEIKDSEIIEETQEGNCNICSKPFPPKGYLIVNPNKETKYCVCWTLAPASNLLGKKS